MKRLAWWASPALKWSEFTESGQQLVRKRRLWCNEVTDPCQDNDWRRRYWLRCRIGQDLKCLKDVDFVRGDPDIELAKPLFPLFLYRFEESGSRQGRSCQPSSGKVYHDSVFRR